MDVNEELKLLCKCKKVGGGERGSVGSGVEGRGWCVVWGMCTKN